MWTRHTVKLYALVGGILLAILMLFLIYRSDSELHVLPAALPDRRRCTQQSNATSLPAGTQTRNVSVFETNGYVVDCITWKTRFEKGSHEYAVLKYPVSDGEQEVKRKSSFINIYEKQAWGGALTKHSSVDPIAYKASGPGSALQNSQSVIAILHMAIDRLKRELNKPIIKLLDLPCGDHQYMTYFLSTRDDVEYTGVDIVPAIISRHKNTYKNNPRYTFKELDIVSEHLTESYDIILCRMMLQHLEYADVLKALYHFSDSGSRYLIATTFPNTKRNVELRQNSIRFRPLNLELSPINLSPPVCTSKEAIIQDHFLSMWELPLQQKV